MYSNRQAPSRDIVNSFGVLGYLRYICSGGVYDGSNRFVISLFCCLSASVGTHYYRCGDGFDSAPVQHYINGISLKELQGDKAIFQPGTLHKVCKCPVYFHIGCPINIL